MSLTLHVNSNEYEISDRYHELYPDTARESSRLIYSAEIAEVFAAAYVELDQPEMAMRVAAPLLNGLALSSLSMVLREVCIGRRLAEDLNARPLASLLVSEDAGLRELMQRV